MEGENSGQIARKVRFGETPKPALGTRCAPRSSAATRFICGRRLGRLERGGRLAGRRWGGGCRLRFLWRWARGRWFLALLEGTRRGSGGCGFLRRVLFPGRRCGL